MNGYYLASQVWALLVTYLFAYKECVLSDILPAFANLDERANEYADAVYRDLVSQPAGEDCDGDLSGFAEDAFQAGLEYYLTKSELRQASINLYTAGLFHFLEQHLADIGNDAGFEAPPRDTALNALLDWYDHNVGVRLEKLSGWQSLLELKLLANCIKHGEGHSAEALDALAPHYFENPIMREYTKSEFKLPRDVDRPLGGHGIFVTVEDFERLSDAALQFARHLHDVLKEHGEDRLPLQLGS